MVVDPNTPIPNLQSPYDPEDDEKDDEEALPEVTINATTQIRGHGNIISVPPMDAVRIAGLLHTMMYGPPGQHTQTDFHPGARQATMRKHDIPKLNVTVNCGATIFGDRNVVGPALGDIARQMQVARQQQMQAQSSAKSGIQNPCPAVPAPVPILTPMRSRTGSESGESDTSSIGSKRKAGDDVEDSPEPKRSRMQNYYNREM
jgi:cytochrome c551/c552